MVRASNAPDNSSPDLAAEHTSELATVTRNGAVESRHLGALAVVNPEGHVLASLGDPEALIFPRSTLKPFQAFASLRAGADLHGESLALACASHVGSVRHQELAMGILQDVGLDPSALRCPEAMPRQREARHQRIRANQGPDRLAFNCSGKHAGFLAATVAGQTDTSTYLDFQHPLQRDVVGLLEALGGEPLGVVGVDGCGAPAPQMSLVALARATAYLAGGTLPEGHGFTDQDALLWARIAPAMLDHAWAVHGEGEENTLTMERTGILAKLGAEAVLILGTPQGYGLALKMLDGGDRASTRVGLEALDALGLADHDAIAGLLADLADPVLGGGQPVGEVRSAGAVRELKRI